MCSRHAEPGAGEQPITYRVAIRSAVSDETFSRNIVAWGPNDLRNHMAELREKYGPDYDLGTPRRVA